MRKILKIIALFIFCASAYAEHSDEFHIVKLESINQKTIAQHCTQNLDEYAQAISRIAKTGVFKKLEKTVTLPSHIAFGGMPRDQPVFWRNRCYTSVSIYISDNEKLELRQVFLVTKNLKTVYLEQLDDEYKFLEKSK